MTMRTQKRSLKHRECTDMSRTLKERQIQRIKEYAKKYNITFHDTCCTLGIKFLTKHEINSIRLRRSPCPRIVEGTAGMYFREREVLKNLQKIKQRKETNHA